LIVAFGCLIVAIGCLIVAFGCLIVAFESYCTKEHTIMLMIFTRLRLTKKIRRNATTPPI
ncbi:hypothetical protein ACI6PS_15310, partial [Flavobacterium sp. PLA-1-15]|uniref:hypothetical protein n=1 Tax=Flavobacterium sp. PLA-1-15 TaxID=3380533 RepID=UPI003B780EA3